jgi:DNA-directed RNA polymerase subunit K/omega
MNEEEKPTPEAEQEPTPEAPREEALESPANKYERIMMAAAEASRLNEELRRKGIKTDRKVTLEALKRVDEGKVKAILENRESLARTKALREAPPETFFMTPPLASDSEGEEESGGGDHEEPTE